MSTNHFQLLGGKSNMGGAWAAAPPAARTVRVEIHCHIRTNRIECMVLREWVGERGGAEGSISLACSAISFARATNLWA